MSVEKRKFRLLTRSDFDGLVCAMLLKSLDVLESMSFAHPKDVQDGKVEVTENDILTNLPYVPGCHLCFDHHDSEEIRTGAFSGPNHILRTGVDSAARVLYDYYGGRAAFPQVSSEIMLAVDKADSAAFTREEILNPEGWVLLSFLMDARTGLGRFRDFRVSNYQLMLDLTEYCKDHTIEEILNYPDVRERVDLYRAHHTLFVDQIRRCAKVHGNLAVLDLRDEEVIYIGNRFMIYAIFPGCDISMHVMHGLRKQNTVFAIGKSILDRDCPTKVGELVLQYGGGGHDAAGTCQVENALAYSVQAKLIHQINADSVLANQLVLV